MGYCAMMKRKLATALRLSSGDWWILLQAWGACAFFSFALRVGSAVRAQRWAAPRREMSPPLDDDRAREVIARIQRLVDTASRYQFLPVRCLERALALQWLLNQRGVETVLRIGVQRENAALAGHAWLEFQGAPLGEPQAIAERFRPLQAQVSRR